MCYRLDVSTVNTVIEMTRIGEFIKTSGGERQHLGWGGGMMSNIHMSEEASFHERSKREFEELDSKLLETAGVHSVVWILRSRLAGLGLEAQSCSQPVCFSG